MSPQPGRLDAHRPVRIGVGMRLSRSVPFRAAKRLARDGGKSSELAESGAALADCIWRNAEDFWGDFKHTDFGRIILPFSHPGAVRYRRVGWT